MNLVAFSALTSPKLGDQRSKGDEVIGVAAGFPTTVNRFFSLAPYLFSWMSISILITSTQTLLKAPSLREPRR